MTVAIPHDPTIPKALKKKTKIKGKGSLISEKIVFFIRTNFAVLFAMKTQSVIAKSVKKMAKTMKQTANLGLSRIKLREGDHIRIPRTNMPAINNEVTALNEKEKLIISLGFPDLGR